jgi:hypothetical protein
MSSWLLSARVALRRAGPFWDRRLRVPCKQRLQVPREQRSGSGSLDHEICAFEAPREALCLPELHRAAQQEIPGPPSDRTLRGASSKVEQMHNYISSIGTKLHEAIGTAMRTSSEATAEH